MSVIKRNASGLQVRADGDGEFEGYAVTWDFVDSYRSKFKRGSFAKTIQERGDRVKVKYNHEVLIGKVAEVREDEKGVFVRGKLNLNVQAAKDVYEFLRDGTLDGLSFAFRVVKDHYEKGVRVFDEVGLTEFGPVDDPASDEALITDVRKDAPEDDRATDFDETLADDEARRAFWVRFYALDETLSDIWWRENGADKAETLRMLDEALSAAHGSLLESAQQFMDRFWSDDERAAPSGLNNPALATTARGWLAAEKKTPEQIAADSVLTVAEVVGLRSGKLLQDRSKFSALPEDVRAAHTEARRESVEQLCKELRDGLSPAEFQRVNALLSRNEPSKDTPGTQPDYDAMLNSAREFRAQFKPEVA